jgi:hypothetical protein
VLVGGLTSCFLAGEWLGGRCCAAISRASRACPACHRTRPANRARPAPRAGSLDAGFARGYTFTVPIMQPQDDGADAAERGGGVPPAERRQFSLLIGLRVVDGSAVMTLQPPPSSGLPAFAAATLYSSPTETEQFVSVPPEVLASAPGQYTLHLRGAAASRRSPLYTVRVVTSASNTTLARAELAAMRELAADCCGAGAAAAPGAKAASYPWCSQLLPAAVADGHSWQDDLCHQAPTVCDEQVRSSSRQAGPQRPGAAPACSAADSRWPVLASIRSRPLGSAARSSDELRPRPCCWPQGHLLVLNLAGGGLSCPAFPAALAKLKRLQSLDLGHNDIQDTMRGAAQVQPLAACCVDAAAPGRPAAASRCAAASLPPLALICRRRCDHRCAGAGAAGAQPAAPVPALRRPVRRAALQPARAAAADRAVPLG